MPVLDDGVVYGICHDITERKEVEERINKEREFTLSLLRGLSLGIAVVDQEGKQILVNDELARMTGFSHEELLEQRAPFKYWAEEGMEEISEVFENALRGLEDEYELIFKRKDGERFPALVSPRKTVNPDGETIFFATVQDISARKRAEEKLRESEFNYRSIFETATSLIISVDRNSIIVDCNNRIHQVLGYRRDEIISQSMAKIIHPDYLAKAQESLNIILADGSLYNEEYQMVRKDGALIDVNINSAGLKDDRGEYVGTICIIEDITDRKQAEAARKASEEKWRSLAENAPDMISTLDHDGTILFLNRTMSGIEPGQRIGESMYEHITSEYHEDFRKSLEKTFQTGETTAFESRGPVDASWYYCRIGAIKCEGEIDTAIMISTNITEHKQAEEKLEKAYEQEKALRQDLEMEAKRRVEFLRALVHELKTPITAVLASGELLTLELPEGPLLEAASNLYRGAENLNRRIDELLDLARGELGILKLQRLSMDPLQLIRWINDDMLPVLSNRKQSLVLEVPSSLPMVWADEDRLRQVLFNLLSNASKYMSEGGRITLKAREEGEHLIIQVQDNGPGIDEDEQERLFDPYYRLVDDRERLSGLGLGLALSKTLVELHGGQMWLESKKGEGSTFSFSVPLKAAARNKTGGETGQIPPIAARETHDEG